MSLIHFDDSAEAQILADELRSENERLRENMDFVMRAVREVEGEHQRIMASVKEIAQAMDMLSAFIYQQSIDYENFHTRQTGQLSDIRERFRQVMDNSPS